MADMLGFTEKGDSDWNARDCILDDCAGKPSTKGFGGESHLHHPIIVVCKVMTETEIAEMTVLILASRLDCRSWGTVHRCSHPMPCFADLTGR